MTPDYVLITPARNEVQNNGRTIESMPAQSRLPRNWVIVSDGSTGRTDEVVAKMTRGVEWAYLLTMPERGSTDFAGKAHAFNHGFASVKGLKFDYIGNLTMEGRIRLEFAPPLSGLRVRLRASIQTMNERRYLR